MDTIIWREAAPALRLLPNEVHVWRASLKSWTDFPAHILSPAESQRGQRFLRDEHRRRFCLARAFLRLILAHYVSTQPADLQFREGRHGKLYLLDNPAHLQFNLSHSQDLAIYALTLQDEIGIDTEWLNTDLAVQPLVARFFTSEEAQTILSLPADQQPLVFYRLWTQKEAYLKALGLGLSGLSQEMQEQGVVTQSIHPASGYAGALAIIRLMPLDSHQISYFDIKPWI